MCQRDLRQPVSSMFLAVEFDRLIDQFGLFWRGTFHAAALQIHISRLSVYWSLARGASCSTRFKYLTSRSQTEHFTQIHSAYVRFSRYLVRPWLPLFVWWGHLEYKPAYVWKHQSIAPLLLTFDLSWSRSSKFFEGLSLSRGRCVAQQSWWPIEYLWFPFYSLFVRTASYHMHFWCLEFVPALNGARSSTSPKLFAKHIFPRFVCGVPTLSCGQVLASCGSNPASSRKLGDLCQKRRLYCDNRPQFVRAEASQVFQSYFSFIKLI